MITFYRKQSELSCFFLMESKGLKNKLTSINPGLTKFGDAIDKKGGTSIEYVLRQF